MKQVNSVRIGVYCFWGGKFHDIRTFIKDVKSGTNVLWYL